MWTAWIQPQSTCNIYCGCRYWLFHQLWDLRGLDYVRWCNEDIWCGIRQMYLYQRLMRFTLWIWNLARYSTSTCTSDSLDGLQQLETHGIESWGFQSNFPLEITLAPSPGTWSSPSPSFPHLPQPNPHDSHLPNIRQINLGLHGISAVTILLFCRHTLLFETSEEQEAALHSKSRHPKHQAPDHARAAHVHIQGIQQGNQKL